MRSCLAVPGSACRSLRGLSVRKDEHERAGFWRASVDLQGDSRGLQMLAGDQVVLWRKADHCLGACSKAPASEKDYCLQSHYDTSGPASNCTVAVSLPAGW